MFNVIFEQEVLKQLLKFPQRESLRIVKAIETKLILNPFPNGNNPKKLKGVSVNRFRVGDYRVLYVLENQEISVMKIEHRKDVYKHL